MYFPSLSVLIFIFFHHFFPPLWHHPVSFPPVQRFAPEIHRHTHHAALLIRRVVISHTGARRERETNIGRGGEAGMGNVVLYVSICDSQGSSQRPRRVGQLFFLMCFSIFLISSVSPVCSNVTLWLQKSISHSALLFICPTCFISHHPLLSLPRRLSFHIPLYTFLCPCQHERTHMTLFTQIWVWVSSLWHTLLTVSWRWGWKKKGDCACKCVCTVKTAFFLGFFFANLQITTIPIFNTSLSLRYTFKLIKCSGTCAPKWIWDRFASTAVKVPV